MCKSSNKGLRIALAQQQAQVAAAQAEAKKAQEETKKIQEKALKLQEKQLKFQEEQAAYVKAQDKKVEELASRPVAPPPPPPAAISVGDDAGTVGAAGDSEQAGVDSRKRGRAALRIDLNTPQTAGGTGLNVPRG